METQTVINERLRHLYESHYESLAEELNSANEELEEENNYEERGTNPLLLMVDENFVNADLKIMFFGQETNFWLAERNDGAFLGEIQPVIDLYKGFYLEGYCYKYGGQFWNGISKFKKLINAKIPDKRIGFIWNNVVKIGKCDKGFPHEINDIAIKHFNVIFEEIKIVQPDIMVFMSGPNYDHEIKKILGEYKTTQIGSFSKRQLCKMEFENLPTSIRTYHPNYLWRNGIDKYFNAIVDEIKTTNP